MFQFLNNTNQVFVDCLANFLNDSKKLSISCLSFYELFLAFDCNKVIWNLLRIRSDVSIFSPCPSQFSSAEFFLSSDFWSF